MRKYWSILQIQLANRLAYTGDLLAQSTSIVVFLFVFLQLWKTTYSALDTDEIAGLTLADTLWYLMLAETIILSKPRLARTITATVKDGSIAYLLNKPFNFLLYQMSVGLADGASSMLFNVLAGGALVWALVSPPPALWGWPFVLVAVFLGWLIDFCINVLIGLSAFVAEETSAFEWVYQKILFLLGGLLIPLDFYPEWLRQISLYLPFAYTVYGPARLFVEPSLEGFITLVAGQLLWLSVIGVVVVVVFRKSTRWLAINGG